MYISYINSNPNQDGPFWGLLTDVGSRKDSSFLKVSHISNNDETWHNYTLRKEDPRNT